MTPDTGQIDQLDGRLIEALRADPRVGLLEIARRVGVARGTVQARLAKLEARGVITGYGPELEPAAMGYPITAFVFVELNQGRLDEATAAARAVPEVLEVDAITGAQDLLCRIVARDTEHLQEIVNGLVASEGIQRCTSHIVLSRQVSPRTGPLVASAAGLSRARSGGPGRGGAR
jgi:DNA-binding Lrp family transcriptional regulator